MSSVSGGESVVLFLRVVQVLKRNLKAALNGSADVCGQKRGQRFSKDGRQRKKCGVVEFIVVSSLEHDLSESCLKLDGKLGKIPLHFMYADESILVLVYDAKLRASSGTALQRLCVCVYLCHRISQENTAVKLVF